METEFDDEQRMVEQKGAQLRGVDQPFLNAHEKGFEVGRERMTMGAAKGRTVCLPLINKGPIKAGKEGAIVGNEGIDLKQSGHGRLVKTVRRRYHSNNSLV